MKVSTKKFKNSSVIDAHLDLLFDVVRQRELGRKKIIETDYLPDFLEGGFNVIVSSIFLDDAFLPEMALRRALNQISALYSEIDESKDKIMLCKSYNDILEAKQTNKTGILLSFEGVEPIYNDMGLLRIFYELGVRGVGLVWSRRNYAGDGCKFQRTREGKEAGLTDFGISLVKTAEDLGMFVDVSHLNDEGFWDVIEIAQRPVIASHSNCRAIVDIPRNLSDDQIKAIASTGGVIGINSANFVTSYDDKDSNIKFLANHIDHITNIVGVEHVGFGFDLCDKLSKYEPDDGPSQLPRKPFDILKSHKDAIPLIQELENRGYSQNELELIIGGNFDRVYKEILK
ncbi:dipeptidase [Wukongibacter baidiensis]|uniref:dipeptidase n=1 Tax=Wukongibacter baidiensis TaxID=1723361 RepID=UPI003D7FB952